MQRNETTWITYIPMQPAGTSIEYVVYVSFKIGIWVPSREFSYDILEVPPDYSLIASIMIAISLLAMIIIYKKIKQ